MSVTSMAETWEGRGASDSNTNDAQATRRFHLKTDSNSDNEIIVAAWVSQYPEFLLGATHPYNPTIRITNRSFDQRSEDPQMWTVTLTYNRMTRIVGGMGADGSAGGSGGSGGENATGEPHPLLRAPQYSFDTETYQEAIEYDRSVPPQLLVNTAGEPLDGVSQDRGRFVFQSVRNVANFNWRSVRRLFYTCNQSPFLPVGHQGIHMFEPRELLLVSASAELMVEHVVYWKRTLRFLTANPDVLLNSVWDPIYFVNRGLRSLASPPTKADGSPNYANLVDAYGHPVTRPGRLDENGYPLGAGADDVLLEFTFHPAKDWGILL